MNDLVSTAVDFGTKAETLQDLYGRLTSAKILPLSVFTVEEWQGDPARILEGLRLNFGENSTLIVRSSAIGEDGAESTRAGHYLSIASVDGPNNVRQAIDAVIQSYITEDCDVPLAGHQVLVQPMMTDAILSGVGFTRDPGTSMPYFVINYEESGDTSSITDGTSKEAKTFYYWKDGKFPPPERLEGVIRLAEELQQLLNYEHLDFEFAYNGTNELYLFQVRRLIMSDRLEPDAAEHTDRLMKISEKIKRSMSQHPFLHGNRTVFGVMPDWNPAEIIGIRPKPLALSLYRELVTDSIWAYQRNNYGYKNLRSFPLLIDFEGLPYIDVRVSFNSFVPKNISRPLADKLVSYYIDRLTEAPVLHDKVEFEIVFSCYTFDLQTRLDMLDQHGFSADDKLQLADSLKQLTNKIINHDTGLWKKDLARIEELKLRHKQICEADLDRISRIYWHLETCKRHGTLPFAGLARAAFIAVQMLQSLVNIGVLSETESTEFMSGIETVSGNLTQDLHQLDRQAFLDQYGHLRPGTYDILSPSYREEPDKYFDWDSISKSPPASSKSDAPFTLSREQSDEIAALLEAHGLQHDVEGLFAFIETAIKGREYAKFVFTRSLSDTLVDLRKLGEEHEIVAEDMAYADIRTIYALYASSHDTKTVVEDSIRQGRKYHRGTTQTVLPPLITDPNSVWAFHMPPSEPNFITRQNASAKICNALETEDLAGKIVLIANADPGFDWIFTRGIAGFVTAYGGANSHMAVRAAELGLPAVIGAGETLFNEWSAAQWLSIDCANRRVQILK